VHGTLTGVVVGRKNEEIHTDKHGRVKVQFHWDRHGTLNDESSCFMRVSQPWAGKSFGAIFIPRVGQEVVVSFDGGDPDRPVVVGCLYNGANHAPWTLPDNRTQSGILSRSTPDGHGENANMLRFEDKKGAEQVYLHAERNLDCIVEANDNQQVGGNRTIAVKGSHHEAVDQEVQIESRNGYVFIKAATSIQLQVGSSTLTMDKDGTISINGTVINTAASDTQVIKGGKVHINP
jgi:type VI secretion system secreted protein VgrG